MPQSPSNARSSLPLHSHPLTSYHLHTSLRLPSLSLTLSFLPPLIMSTPHLLPPFLLHLPFINPSTLPLFTPRVVSSSSFLSISGPCSILFPPFSSCRPPASSGSSCLSSVFARYISSLFLWGGILCVLSTVLCYLAHQVGWSG